MSLRFSEDGPIFPNALIDAMLDGGVAFLCGAGVSAPQLPMFGDLVTQVYARLGVESTAGECAAISAGRYEEALGALSRRLVDPDRLYHEVTDILTLSNPDLARHKVLLRLSRARDNRIVLVTTNFDTLFERAVEEIEGRDSGRRQSLAGQALPPPGSEMCHGIIHLHGRILDSGLGLDATPVVLTSAEYGDAYMRSGWAARFLFDLVRCKTIVLIGYSANDAPVRYFLNLLEGDRARFEDLRTVYAFEPYESHPGEADARWSTIAVTPLAYQKAPAGEADRYVTLWRDLAQLADFVDRPRAGRRARATAILESPFASTTEIQRDEIAWLLTGKGDLWDIVVTSVEDPSWFDHFQTAKLWTSDEAPDVMANWSARDLTNRTRLEVAIEWRDRLGPRLLNALNQRLTHLLEKVPHPWGLAWKTLISSAHRAVESTMRQYLAAQALQSPTRTDHDLRNAVRILTPAVQMKARWRTDSDQQPSGVLSLQDIVHVSLDLDDNSEMKDLNAAIRSIPESKKRLAQLCTDALLNVGFSAIDVDLITQDWDAMDRSVPSVESHDQNQYHDGVVHLCVLLTDLLPQLVEEDIEYARALAISWRSLPGTLGHRMWVHAQRDTALFNSNQAAENILALPREAFWSIRRELVLVLKERIGGASPQFTERIVRRILDESAFLYSEHDVAQGEADWRPQARSHRVWLLLTPIRMAGVLQDVGQSTLAFIADKYPFIVGDYDEQDLFSSYMSGVRTVQGDPAPLFSAVPEARLDIARQLHNEKDFEAQASWSAYCRAEPEAAFEVLKDAEPTKDNARLWSDFLNVLVSATIQEATRAGALGLVSEAFSRLSNAGDEFLLRQLSSLSHLLPVYQSGANDKEGSARAWWDRLWRLAEAHEPEVSQEDASRFYDQVINRPTGRLVEWLLSSIDNVRATCGISKDDSRRLRAVVSSNTAAGRLARGVCARNAGFLLVVHPRLALGEFRRCLARDGLEGKTLRAVLLDGPQLSLIGTRAFKKAIFTALCETVRVDGGAAHAASKVLSPVVSWRMTPSTLRSPISPEEVRELLTRVPHAVLAGAAHCLRRWVGEIGGGNHDKAWRAFIGPLFELIWPNEVQFKRAAVSKELAALCVGAGPAFPEAFQLICHHLSPFEGGSNSIWFLKSSDAIRVAPTSCLELLWSVCGPGSSGRTADMAEVLDQIAAAHPALEVDRRLQWLEQYRAFRYG